MIILKSIIIVNMSGPESKNTEVRADFYSFNFCSCSQSSQTRIDSEIHSNFRSCTEARRLSTTKIGRYDNDEDHYLETPWHMVPYHFDGTLRASSGSLHHLIPRLISFFAPSNSSNSDNACQCSVYPTVLSHHSSESPLFFRHRLQLLGKVL
jgi:hypothetical protein